jgi:hypothetical protein
MAKFLITEYKKVTKIMSSKYSMPWGYIYNRNKVGAK